ncbi:hypothetical protein Droror1_Dr00014104 [Drosera rotundifolia]
MAIKSYLLRDQLFQTLKLNGECCGDGFISHMRWASCLKFSNHEQVKTVLQERREDLVLDRSLESCPIDEVNKVFNIALMCLESDPSKRPTMADAVKMLEYRGKYFEDAVSE